jgi:ribulose-phosphate 3-epimerase
MAPSILSADFSRLGEAVAAVEAGGADLIHVDVMDGHFVPNLTIGPPVISALKKVTKVPLDVHLMISNADHTVDWYLDAGADAVSVHVEACRHLHRVLRRIREAGASPAVALNPATPVSAVKDVLGEVDMLLVMSVNPGFGGQAFIEHSIERIAELAELCDSEGASCEIQVDGGITVDTAPLVTAVGARCLVAGNAVFAQPDPAAAMNAIRAAGSAAV